MMKNSGLSSVGHLLKQRSDEDIRGTLRHFCTVLTANLGENLANKSSVYWMFDQFFSTLKPDFPGFVKFLNGVLRCPGADPEDFEVAVEKCVWDIVKYDYKEFVTGNHLNTVTWVNHATLYRLFCLFNRFCDLDQTRMRMAGPSLAYVIQKLGLNPPDSDLSMDLKQFISYIIERRDQFVLTSIKKLYDQLVRDVLVGEQPIMVRIGCKMSGFCLGQPLVARRVTLTSQNLIIQEIDVLDVLEDKLEPPGKILEKISLVGTDFQLGRAKNTSLISHRSRVETTLTLTTFSQLVELTFDVKKDPQILMRWTRAMIEAQKFVKSNTNNLDRAKLEIGAQAPETSPTSSRVNSDGSVTDFIGSDKTPISAIYPALDHCLSDSELVMGSGTKTPPMKPRRKNGISKIENDSLQI